jgi:uncharacterized protein (TIGR02145 family)
MCKNFDSKYPGSKMYDDDEANRALYGCLYTNTQINNPGFAPYGWHVPTLAEWQILINFLGGSLVAGGKLKQVGLTNWNAPNTGASDNYGFAAKGTGFYGFQLGVGTGFHNLLDQGNLWSKTGIITLSKDNAEANVLPVLTDYYIGVRLIKDAIPIPPIISAVNCNTNIAGSLEYNNDPALGVIYGRLYTWNMIPAIEAANPGFHVMTKLEYELQVANYGGGSLAGGHLKETGTIHWTAPNPADNSSGLTLLPGGAWSLVFSAFVRMGLEGYFWLKDEYSVADGHIAVVYNTDTVATIGAHTPKGNYFSVRLVSD